ncbi:MAG: hypothetical protein V3V07_10455 [candidate division NC10 bacterium]
MTIGIGLAVPDGIALAADTQTTWIQTISKAREKGTGKEIELESPINIPVGWSKMARKLFPLKFAGNQFAVATAGMSSLNNRTMYSIFKSLERSYAGEPDCNEVLRHLINGIEAELKLHHQTDDLSKAPHTTVTFVLAGYEGQDVSRPFLENHTVFSGEITVSGAQIVGHHRFWTNIDKGRFGCCWIGMGEFVSHIVNHNNKKLPELSGQYHLMTLTDAVDYTTFLAKFTCDFQRFAVMVPDCARPIISATLTPDGYEEKILE